MVKKLIVLLVVLLLTLGGCFASLVFIAAFVDTSETDNCDPGSVTASVSNASLSPSDLTVKGAKMTVPQSRNAQAIIRTALSKGLTSEAAVVAIMTSIQESELINLNYGDRDSAGLFQQRPSQGWGTFEQVTNTALSILAYFGIAEHTSNPGLTDIVGWQNMTPNDAAQAVQRSGTPDAFAQHQSEAEAIVAAYVGNDGETPTVVSTDINCPDENPIEKMVQAALSRVDQPISGLSSSTGSVRIATFNVLGSNHTSSESAMSRIATSVELIKNQQLGVVGLQELRPDQRERMMQLFGSSYDIFPNTPVYGSSQMSANSIIWDTSQFEFVSGKSTPMPFYFGGQQLDIPLAELREIATGSIVTVINTHDPAKPENARLRFLNANEHADLTDRLTAQGKLVFFTGDFNSGFSLRSEANITYQNDPENLTTRIMSRSGVMANGYNDSNGQNQCPNGSTSQGDFNPVDHVFVPVNGVDTLAYCYIREGTASDHPVVFAEVSLGESELVEPFEPSTSVDLVSWAANEAGLTLPDSLSELYQFEGIPAEGVSAQWLDPETTLMRGDIPLWSTDEDADPEEAGIALGAVGAGSKLRISTYNITSKEQFANYGLAAENITSTYKMDIVGTQELIGQSYRLVQQKVKQAGYGIYPDYPAGLNTVRHGLSGRSVVYNKNRFVLDESRTTMFRHPRYPDDRAARVGDEEVIAGQANVPVVYFTDEKTGQPLIVVNFHNVAFARYAKIRYDSNLILVEQMQQLQAENPGVPIFLTGDFNEGTGVRRIGTAPNVTYQERSENLVYCMFASNKLMVDTAVESQAKPHVCPNPSIGGVDYIYATPSVEVESGSSRTISPAQAGTDHPVKYVDVAIPEVGLVEGSSENLNFVVGLTENIVDILKPETKKLVGIVRLTVTDLVIPVGDIDGWTAPMKKGTYVKSTTQGGNYGWRIHPVRGTPDFHNGVDLGAVTGAGVFSIGSGRVVQSRYDICWGNLVVIDHGGFYSLYTHLDSFALGLTMNGVVKAGQQIGTVGNTGKCSAGSHLHFSVGTSLEILSGEEAGSVEPVIFMQERGIVL